MVLPPPPLNKLLLGIICSLVMLLLVGHRLGTVWAGGPGMVWHCPAEMTRSTNQKTQLTVPRGGLMRTGEEQFAEFNICDGATVVSLDENTEVKLITSKPQVELQLIQGKIVVNGQATVTARNLHLSTTSPTAYTHYSWKDELAVSAAAQTTTFNTVTQAEISATPFTASASTSAAFFSWAKFE